MPAARASWAASRESAAVCSAVSLKASRFHRLAGDWLRIHTRSCGDGKEEQTPAEHPQIK